MRIVRNILILGLATFISCTSQGISTNTKNEHLIIWNDKQDQDFSFKDKWSYPEGIYINVHDQLSCDGLCPTRTDKMKDQTGRIIQDSLEIFYSIVDTSHLYHSLKSSNRMYEYSGTNYIDFSKTDNKIIGRTKTNVSTHSSLTIELDGNKFNAFVDLNSIRNLGKHRFPLSKGNLEIDTTCYARGIIKANFDFKFRNTIEQSNELLWKGQIFSRIKTE